MATSTWFEAKLYGAGGGHELPLDAVEVPLDGQVHLYAAPPQMTSVTRYTLLADASTTEFSMLLAQGCFLMVQRITHTHVLLTLSPGHSNIAHNQTARQVK